MKLLGAMLLLLTGALAGILARLRMKKRVNTLRTAAEGIRKLADRIRYTNAPITELIQQDLGCIYSQTTENPREQWKLQISQKAEKWGLSEEDMVVLFRFLDQIGRSDRKGEMQLCEEYHTVLSEQLAEARERLTVKGNLYITLGCSFGFLAVLVLW